MADSRRIRIVLVIGSLSFGGREKIVVELANGLSPKKYEVFIVLFSKDHNKQLEQLKDNVKVFTLPINYNCLEGFKAIYFWFKGLRAIKAILKKINPDIVHSHTFFQQLLFVSSAIKLQRAGIQHFHTVHTQGLYYSEKGIVNAFRLLVEKVATRLTNPYIIAISEPVYHKCIKYFNNNAASIRCICNGVDEKIFDYQLRQSISKSAFGFKQGELIVTYVARMDKGKNHITLLKAWQKVQKRSNVKLCLVGDGELRAELELFVAENKMLDSVRFLGNIREVQKILAITDIGVFASLFEGFPVALLEKAFMRTPIIASEIPIVTTIIKDGYSGLLFKPKDHDALSERLITLMEDAALRESLGSKIFNEVQQYSLASMIVQHEEFYESRRIY
ncbi:glycosyltransferase family 4 protein [Foetidibacter luteolus]|uniref:glycosyltransferase family 4 protein n=1 Tax=Foetidibacter luteolus TaxID=2608880 RepID=UPI00129AF61E|nr:glycosyltransferase family 4 protein [Foetidibacter luteolus]